MSVSGELKLRRVLEENALVTVSVNEHKARVKNLKNSLSEKELNVMVLL